MNKLKSSIFQKIEDMKVKLIEMSDFIHDNPEEGNNEFQASKLLMNFFRENNFEVKVGIGGFPTSFKAVYNHLSGGPTIGLLCEYDALKGLGHACAHHMQGPSILGAAIAVAQIIKATKEYPVKLVVIGTPAEETIGAKVSMVKQGIFDDLDVALMMHGSDRTTVDRKSLALSAFQFNFKGKSAHAAIAPEKGIDALDGVLMTFNGMEYLREHVRDDVRIHGIINDGGQATNVISDKASAIFDIRADDRVYLDAVIERVFNVVKGAALATGTTVEIIEKESFDNKIGVEILCEELLKNAKLAGAKNITPPREKTGSTDFGNVTYKVPGTCLRVAFIPLNVSSHTAEWEKAGTSSEAHDAVIVGSKALAGMCIDLILKPELLKEIQQEFHSKKSEL